ncbi:hypothetical protein B0H13DRAFT_1851208 [Mycena leptocephala]|nr:hypothetical protein B0H13DRAFT_1851208 [Mycena leptocephala]
MSAIFFESRFYKTGTTPQRYISSNSAISIELSSSGLLTCPGSVQRVPVAPKHIRSRAAPAKAAAEAPSDELRASVQSSAPCANGCALPARVASAITRHNLTRINNEYRGLHQPPYQPPSPGPVHDPYGDPSSVSRYLAQHAPSFKAVSLTNSGWNADDHLNYGKRNYYAVWPRTRPMQVNPADYMAIMRLPTHSLVSVGSWVRLKKKGTYCGALGWVEAFDPGLNQCTIYTMPRFDAETKFFVPKAPDSDVDLTSYICTFRRTVYHFAFITGDKVRILAPKFLVSGTSTTWGDGCVHTESPRAVVKGEVTAVGWDGFIDVRFVFDESWNERSFPNSQVVLDFSLGTFVEVAEGPKAGLSGWVLDVDWDVICQFPKVNGFRIPLTQSIGLEDDVAQVRKLIEVQCLEETTPVFTTRITRSVRCFAQQHSTEEASPG